MESVGQRFKAARERKRVSLSQAAAKTRIKVQVLEGMERDDYSKIPAPTYARGFIRMYAEFLGLEAGPLLKDYAELAAGKPVAAPEPVKRPVPPKAVEPAREREAVPEREEPVVGETPATSGHVVSEAGWKRASMLVGGLVLLVIVIALVARDPAGGREEEDQPAQPPVPKRNLSAIVEEPAEPYINVAPANPSP